MHPPFPATGAMHSLTEMSAEVSRAAAQQFYEDFSLAVGQRDWLVPNLRHEQLKLVVDRLLAGRRDLRIADVGCGAGVMTDHLARYGDVVGVDFSAAAIAAARRCSPGVGYRVGGLEQLDGPYDVIALFDVLEHINREERPAFIVQLAALLDARGLLFVSTPYPSMTAHRRRRGDDSLQIIDEEVELATLVSEAGAAGLQLLSYDAYDVFGGSPEYQTFVLTHVRAPGGAADLMPRSLRRRQRIVTRREYVWARRARHAARAARRGDLATARWFLSGRPPRVRS
jgi:2-polyprenyl-3-methyl-5-hydroxy-6-metoxy-1,4-benzoquinol methylase